MSTPEDYFTGKVGDALVACAKAREAVPLEWGEAKQECMRRNIAAAMGLLQPPDVGLCVTQDRQTYEWWATVCDVTPENPPDYERRASPSSSV